MPDKRVIQDRLAFIDGWRGVAVLLVLLAHTWVYAGAPAMSVHFGSREFLLASFPATGHIGVNLFLVLSGFCLSYPLLRNESLYKGLTIWSFWRRRAERIVPAYYISIALTFAVLWAMSASTSHLPAGWISRLPPQGVAAVPPVGEVWPHLFFIHTLWPEHATTITGSYWSLALEFQLYLMFPLLVDLSIRWGVWRTFAAVLGVQLAYRYGLDLLLHHQTLWEYEFTLTKSVFGRMLDFYCGIAAAHLITQGQKSRMAQLAMGPLGLSLGLACVGTAFALRSQLINWWITMDVLWAAGFALLICQSSREGGVLRKLFSWRLLTRIGLISYSIYLIHETLVRAFGSMLRIFFRPGTAFLAGLAFIPAVILLSAVFFVLFEAPFLRKRKPAAPKQQIRTVAYAE